MLSVPCLTHLSVDVSGKRFEALDVSTEGLETLHCIDNPRHLLPSTSEALDVEIKMTKIGNPLIGEWRP